MTNEHSPLPLPVSVKRLIGDRWGLVGADGGVYLESSNEDLIRYVFAAVNQAPLVAELAGTLEWALGWLPQTPLTIDQPTRDEFAERLYQAEQLLTRARMAQGKEDKAQ